MSEQAAFSTYISYDIILSDVLQMFGGERRSGVGIHGNNSRNIKPKDVETTDKENKENKDITGGLIYGSFNFLMIFIFIDTMYYLCA